MPEVALVDMRLGNNRGYDGGDIIKELKKCIPDLVSIIITADGEPDKLNKAMMNGAVYCLEKPFTVGEIVGVVNEQYARYVCGEGK
jgi:DNA-binding NtrC family response regulator